MDTDNEEVFSPSGASHTFSFVDEEAADRDDDEEFSSSGDSPASFFFDENADDWPIRQKSTVERAEKSTQELFDARFSQTDEFKKNLKGSEMSKWKEIEELMENSLETECTKQELCPVSGVQLLQECQHRQGELLALESLSIELIEINTQLGSQLDKIQSAKDYEEQIIEDLVNWKRRAVKQQKQLKKLDKKHQNSIVALRENQHKKLLKHLKFNREERDKLLDEWAGARRELLDQVEATKGNTLTVQSDISTRLEQARQEETTPRSAILGSLEVLHQMLPLAQHSTSPGVSDQSSTDPGTDHDCSICFEELDSGGNTDGKKRACLRPCNHATICWDCAVMIWRNSKPCPICKATLTTKPEVIHL